MHLALADWLIIIVFLIIIVVVGLSYTRLASKSLANFFVGGRNIPWYIAGLSMVATTFAADTPLAVADLVAQNGISGNWLWWNFLMGGMLTTFFFARLWRRSGVLTEVELIELRYDGKVAAFLRGFKAVYLGVFLNVLIIGWVSQAMIAIMMVFFEMSQWQAMMLTFGMMGFVAIYSSFSGILGIAITDSIQFVLAMTGCIVLAILVLHSPEIGGMSGLKTKLPAGSLNFIPKIGGEGANSTASVLSIGIGAFLARISMQWWASWYPGAEPGGGGYIAQRMFSTRSEKDAVYATLFFQVAHYCIRPWPWIIVGLCAMVLYPDLANKQEGFVYAMRDFLPVGLRGLLLASFIAAFMSTISTQLNWGASYLVNDLYLRFINKEAEEKKLVVVSRLSTLLLMIIALIVAWGFSSITSIWNFIIECGAGLGLVLILRWYWWRINAWSELVATIGSIIYFAIARLLHLEFPVSFFFIVGMTTLSWILATFLTPATGGPKLIEFVNKVRPDGLWGPVYKMTDVQPEKNSLSWMILAWALAVIFTYSILFLSGKIILAEYEQLIPLSVLSLVSLIALNYVLKKVKLFRD